MGLCTFAKAFWLRSLYCQSFASRSIFCQLSFSYKSCKFEFKTKRLFHKPYDVSNQRLGFLPGVFRYKLAQLIFPFFDPIYWYQNSQSELHQYVTYRTTSIVFHPNRHFVNEQPNIAAHQHTH